MARKADAHGGLLFPILISALSPPPNLWLHSRRCRPIPFSAVPLRLLLLPLSPPCCLLSYLPSRATLATARFLARAAASSLLPTIHLPLPAATARINPLFIDGLEIFDEQNQKALEQGLDGVILEVEDMDDIIKLKKERGKEPVTVDKGYCVKGWGRRWVAGLPEYRASFPCKVTGMRVWCDGVQEGTEPLDGR
ncbi:hypothetical protein E2562_006806 [Oryza meyeriana var. granulata]|uniref:Uncharacterized protein n=1 Tax=Oryza meyeriana var. granulata TaxID=110450 RepID=A0A6G1C4D5_9ORYZ|nr:hypothetical protein E2562_006806 [Oryza meyeriana var. granulata]